MKKYIDYAILLVLNFYYLKWVLSINNWSNINLAHAIVIGFVGFTLILIDFLAFSKFKQDSSARIEIKLSKEHYEYGEQLNGWVSIYPQKSLSIKSITVKALIKNPIRTSRDLDNPNSYSHRTMWQDEVVLNEIPIALTSLQKYNFSIKLPQLTREQLLGTDKIDNNLVHSPKVLKFLKTYRNCLDKINAIFQKYGIDSTLFDQFSVPTLSRTRKHGYIEGVSRILVHEIVVEVESDEVSIIKSKQFNVNEKNNKS